MRGYKATLNYKCRDQYFEIGKTYELEGDPVICERGFHFCPNMSDVLNYYGYKPNKFKLLEVEALGDIVGEENKACTNKIKIIREVPMEEWDFYKGLPNGHCEIHYKISRGIECWYEYDERGNVIHHKNSYGFKFWKKYDENGNLIHHKDSYGYEYWYEYDERGNEIHYKDTNEFEYWKEYDENGRVIHYKDTNGIEWWKEYDENGDVIHYASSNGIEY